MITVRDMLKRVQQSAAVFIYETETAKSDIRGVDHVPSRLAPPKRDRRNILEWDSNTRPFIWARRVTTCF